MLRRVLVVALLVESIQIRARAAAEAVIPPASSPTTFALSQLPPDTGHRPASLGPVRERPRSSPRSGASDEPAPPSEDPH